MNQIIITCFVHVRIHRIWSLFVVYVHIVTSFCVCVPNIIYFILYNSNHIFLYYINFLTFICIVYAKTKSVNNICWLLCAQNVGWHVGSWCWLLTSKHNRRPTYGNNIHNIKYDIFDLLLMYTV